MQGPTRVTQPLLDVLEFLLAALHLEQGVHGWAIMKATKRPGPTIYGVLDRLEDGGWVVGQWEDREAEPNKPRRRFYRLTPDGAVAAQRLLAERRSEVPGRPRFGPAQTLGAIFRAGLNGRAT
jgi:PadR family transcriptional regulator PadR